MNFFNTTKIKFYKIVSKQSIDKNLQYIVNFHENGFFVHFGHKYQVAKFYWFLQLMLIGNILEHQWKADKQVENHWKLV